MNTETKTASASLEMKGETGEFELRLATKRTAGGEFVVDADSDIYADGAVGEQKTHIGCPEHGTSCGGPAGEAKTFETELDIRARGRLDLSTDRGRAEFLQWKAVGAAIEFSYVYSVTDAQYGTIGRRDVRMLKSVRVLSIDRVSRGAGVGTGLVSLKSGCGCPGESQGWRAEVEAVKASLEARETRPMIEAEYRRFLDLTSDYPTVSECDVPKRLRAGAEVGLKLAAAKLGITAVPLVRWYRRNEGGKASRWGYTELLSKGEINLAVYMPESRVVEVASHELAHMCGADEGQALDFGREIRQAAWADDRYRF